MDTIENILAFVGWVTLFVGTFISIIKSLDAADEVSQYKGAFSTWAKVGVGLSGVISIVLMGALILIGALFLE